MYGSGERKFVQLMKSSRSASGQFHSTTKFQWWKSRITYPSTPISLEWFWFLNNQPCSYLGPPLNRVVNITYALPSNRIYLRLSLRFYSSCFISHSPNHKMRVWKWNSINSHCRTSSIFKISSRNQTLNWITVIPLRMYRCENKHRVFAIACSIYDIQLILILKKGKPE